ncbi:MAG: SRPBCC domain-containing protein [Solirubrobacterales bacterium]
MSEQQEPSGTEPGINITRVLEAPRERVWREWTEPEAFADWFGAPSGEVPLATVEMDVREGGSWELTMFAGPGRQEINWKGEYLEVAEPERLVLTMTDQPDDSDRALITVVLTDLGDGRTEMVMEQSGPAMSPEGFERARKGWGGFFDRLAERLAEG